MAKRTYENKGIRVFWDSEKCVHSEHCVHGLPQVFDRERRPWVNVDAAEAEEIRRVIATCPSGALTCECFGTTDDTVPGDLPVINVLKDGPYQVCGKVSLVGVDGVTIQTGDICALCRCGKSGNKPFCDGTHAEVGFRD
jgi:uncharacterized Fe-S cluster protein YjdI